MIWAAIALAALFLLSAFFSASETILFSLTDRQRAAIESKSPSAGRAVAKCLEDSALLLSTLLVGNTLVNFAIATLSWVLMDAAFPRWGGAASVPAATAALLVFGEITPKRLALRFRESLAPADARLILVWKWLLHPFNLAFRFSARAFSGAIRRERRALSDAELVSVLEAAAEKGDFSKRDADMIEGVLRLSELHANDEMTPRVDIEGLDSDLPEEARARRAAGCAHRFMPVFRRTPDAIEGVFDRKTGETIDALFVPEQMTLDDLLVVFAKSRRRLAVVVDEYGGTAGIITRNDVLEIIFGPDVFGHGGSEPSMVRRSRNSWEIDARMSLDEINRRLGLELEAEDADRLSGWVAFHAERIPHAGQQIEAQGCRATVLKRRKRRVSSVLLEVLEYPGTASDEELIAETDEQVEKTAEDDR